MSLMPPINQAMVLAAGLGKRLYPLTLSTPKPLVLLNNRPVLDYIFSHLSKANITRCIVNTHHLSSHIDSYLKGYSSGAGGGAMTIETSAESVLLETGGGITQALPFFQGNPFFSINGDIWWQDADEEENQNNREKKRLSALIQLKEQWDPNKMDALLLLIDPANAIGFSGKGDFFLTPTGQLSHRGSRESAPYIYGGVQLLHPRLFTGCHPVPFSMVELFKKAEHVGRLYGTVHGGLWGDMGSFHALSLINDFLSGAKSPPLTPLNDMRS